MPGDTSRYSFHPERRFISVRQQQGRVSLDSDWNEGQDIAAERNRLLALDSGGFAWIGAETPDAFLIGAIAGPPADLSIGVGRLWLDGRLAEHPDGEIATYLDQPFLPEPPPFLPGVDTIVYLDMWEREVSWAEEPRLLDVALGGVDTTTRLQQVWQVRLLPQRGVPAACGVDLDQLLPPSAGRLTTAANAPPAPDDPCIVPPNAGYRGIENRHYRVEIAVPGPPGTARFKWSRDNGSIVARVSGLSISGAQTRLTVNRIGRDETLRFRIGDWVTLTDDHREFHGEAGQMARVADIDEARRIIVLDRAVPTGGGRAFGANGAELAARNTRLQRWDQQAPRNAVDADGLMTVAAGPIDLEDGVEVSFSVAAPGGEFHIGDWWVFAARTADASVEILDEAPPRGIHHRYLQLAAITAAGLITDCRPKPDAQGCCTFVVAPGQSIQAAIDALPPEGGCVCLKSGVHLIDAPIVIRRDNVHLHGESLAAQVRNRMPTPLLRVERATGTRIDSIRFYQTEARSDPALLVLGAIDTEFRDCEVRTDARIGQTGLLAGRSDTLLLDGLRFVNAVVAVQLDAASRDNSVRGCSFAMAEAGPNLPATFAIVAIRSRGFLTVENCEITGAVNGIIVNDDTDAQASAVTPVRIVHNNIVLTTGFGGDRAFAIDSAGAFSTVAGNLIEHPGGELTAIRLSGRHSTASGNQITSHAKVPGTIIAILAGLEGSDLPVPGIVIAENRLHGPQFGIALVNAGRSEVRGNIVGTAGQPSGYGIILTNCDDCRVSGNGISNALAGVLAMQGARNIVSENHIEGGEAGIYVALETAATISANVVTGTDTLGIAGMGVALRFAVTGNRVIRCGSQSQLAQAVAAYAVLGEWQVSANEIVDTGLPPLAGGTSAPAAHGINGDFILEARVQDNVVNYAQLDARPATAEDRALRIRGYLEYSTGELTIGYPLHVSGNSFTGRGATYLVEIHSQNINDNMNQRFEHILYSGNHHWHWNGDRTGRNVTVGMTARSVSVSGNRVKALLAGFPSWNLGGRPGPFLGNSSTGPVTDRPTPVTQFPSPASAFNQ